jgi:glycosyltransferase involved in cell wall biosynthesis
MPFEPLTSIVIPVYNGARYLGEAIDSALGQTYPNVEVLVVDDGSNDDGATEKRARSYGDRITYIAKPNGGVATALNEGIRRMRGDYFSWLSHDDVYYPNKVARQVARLQDAPRDAIVYGDVDYIDPEGRFLRRDQFARWAECSMLAALVVAWPVNGCATLVPRAALDDVGVFDETMRTTQD